MQECAWQPNVKTATIAAVIGRDCPAKPDFHVLPPFDYPVPRTILTSKSEDKATRISHHHRTSSFSTVDVEKGNRPTSVWHSRNLGHASLEGAGKRDAPSPDTEHPWFKGGTLI